MAREVVTRSADETRALGRETGSRLKAGDVVLLEGGLGTGKTTFVKGVAQACGVQGMVRSPTFALMHRYRGRPDVVHIDLYRETRPGALSDLAWEEWEGDAVTVVEWPRELARDLWPDATRIRFEHVAETERRITLP